MIPLKLTLKNFLSYGPTVTTVDFEPYQLMCLSGKNGHGKSALLDAITWTLWGHARKTGGVPRADEQLIHLGQSNMLVIFEFMSNQQRYRVRREVTISHARLLSTLDFGHIQTDTSIKPLTEKTIRATQERIQAIIGLTFDAFCNSVFLRQGHSDEFSRKSAQERKEILGTILGLERYERARKYANEQLRTLQTEREGLLKLQEHVHTQLAQLPNTQQAIDTCAQTVRACVDEQKKLQEQLENLATEHRKLQINKDDWHAQEKECNTIKKQLIALEHELTLAHTHTINNQEIALARLLEQERALKEKYTHVQERDSAIHTELTQLTQQLENTNTQCKNYAQAKVTLIQHTHAFEKRKALYHTFTGESSWVKKQLHIVAQQQLSQVNNAAPNCPLCEQQLAHTVQRFLAAKLIKQAHFFEHRLQRMNDFLQISRPLLREQKNIIDELTNSVQTAQRAQERIQELNLYIQRLTVEKEQLAQVLQQLYKQQQELICQKQVLAHTLDHAREQAHALCQQHEGWRELNTQVCASERKQQLMPTLKELQEREHALNTRTEQVKQMFVYAQSRHTHAVQEHARAQNIYEHVQKLQAEHAHGELQLKKLEHECDIYKAIVHALSKDGIQALLIESVIPELEHEANMLLAHLSDQNAHIMIESLRDLKSGGTKETLDIKIADNAGIRPYELFSGGEAFRIDFALRIAISQLLARRAGATLQTVIIDEGFGSQDEDGLQRLVDALHKIRSHFAKIIVVSHLSALKDQLPVHFIVQKFATGSSVRVMHYE